MWDTAPESEVESMAQFIKDKCTVNPEESDFYSKYFSQIVAEIAAYGLISKDEILDYLDSLAIKDRQTENELTGNLESLAIISQRLSRSDEVNRSVYRRYVMDGVNLDLLLNSLQEV